TAGLSNGAHTLTARATDTAGNATTSAAVSVTVDNAAPTVAVTAPAASSMVSGTVTVKATASDNVGVSGVQFFVDGTAVGTLSTTAPYSYSWNTTGLSDGSHTLTAKATDAAGNATTSAAVSVTVNNTVPTVTSVSPANGSTGVAVG